MPPFTVRLPDDLAMKLDALAKKLDRAPSHVAAQAVSDFVARQERQMTDIEAGLREAQRDEFATEAEVATTIARFTTGKRRR